MPKRTVKRCIRPQCMEIYPEAIQKKYCDCGALLQLTEFEYESSKKGIEKRVSQNKSQPKYKSNDSFHSEKDDDPKSIEENLDYKNNNTDETESEAVKRGAALILLLEDDERRYDISDTTRIGRKANGIAVDIDLTEFAGKDISKEHAVIKKESDGYYITNVSRNHSVRILDQEENETTVEYGKKVRLKSEDGILLSKKVLLQFVEGE